MNLKNSAISILGKGAYSVSEAGHLTGVSDSKIRRWLLGQERIYHGKVVTDQPLWAHELPLIDDGLYLTFRDLMELRMVDRFRQQKLSMPYLRKVVRAAQDLIGDSHPFSTSRFKTDGRRLYVELISRLDEPQLIEVLSGQHAFHAIIAAGLRDIEFENGIASIWRPESGAGEVVIDPKRGFGQAILARSGIPTATIAHLNDAGRTPKSIAGDFELPEREVRAALSFERRLAA